MALLIFAHGRKPEGKARAAVRHIFRADRSAVSFDDGADNGQTHSHAGLLGGKEMIEDFRGAILWQPNSEIAHADFCDSTFADACTNNNASVRQADATRPRRARS